MRRKLIGLLLILAIMASVPIINSGYKIKKDTKTLLSSHKLTKEEIITGIAANNFCKHYENETIKALILILNTNYKANKIDKKDILSKDDFIRKYKKGQEYYSNIENTVKEMSDQYITYKNKAVYIPYFKISKGCTEKDKKYPYLKSSACPWDCLKKDFKPESKSVGVSINSLNEICKRKADYKKALAYFVNSE